jgi:hypothetical protein
MNSTSRNDLGRITPKHSLLIAFLFFFAPLRLCVRSSLLTVLFSALVTRRSLLSSLRSPSLILDPRGHSDPPNKLGAEGNQKKFADAGNFVIGFPG